MCLHCWDNLGTRDPRRAQSVWRQNDCHSCSGVNRRVWLEATSSSCSSGHQSSTLGPSTVEGGSLVWAGILYFRMVMPHLQPIYWAVWAVEGVLLWHRVPPNAPGLGLPAWINSTRWLWETRLPDLATTCHFWQCAPVSSEEHCICHCSTTGPQSTLKWCHLGRYIYYSIYELPNGGSAMYGTS